MGTTHAKGSDISGTEKDSRLRPVINLKKLNQSVKTEHFKMESIHMLKDLPKAGDWMAKIDLKDAYFMIPIAQEDRVFLYFEWKNKSYRFNCLPFGLSSPMGLYQDHKTGSASTSGAGPSSNNLHRRYSNHGRDRVTAEGTHPGNSIPAGKLGTTPN